MEEEDGEGDDDCDDNDSDDDDDDDDDDDYDNDDSKSRINIATTSRTIVPLTTDKANMTRPAADSQVIRLHSKSREINSGHHVSTSWP